MIGWIGFGNSDAGFYGIQRPALFGLITSQAAALAALPKSQWKSRWDYLVLFQILLSDQMFS